MPYVKKFHEDAIRPKWIAGYRIHWYYLGDRLAGTVTLSPVGTKPTTYTWAIEGRGETGEYKQLGNAKRRVELVIFERSLAQHLKR